MENQNTTNRVYVNGQKPNVFIYNGKQIPVDYAMMAFAKQAAGIFAIGMKIKGVRMKDIRAKFNLKSKNWKDIKAELTTMMEDFKKLERPATQN